MRGGDFSRLHVPRVSCQQKRHVISSCRYTSHALGLAGLIDTAGILVKSHTMKNGALNGPDRVDLAVCVGPNPRYCYH